MILGRPFRWTIKSARTGLIKHWRPVRERLIVPFYKLVLFRLATIYRSLFPDVAFIAITGSCGKTTAKELIAGVLSSQFQGIKHRDSSNIPTRFARTIFRLRPWHKFCVLEVAVGAHDRILRLEESLSFIKPRIGVITNVGTDHISVFRSVEAIAAEKGKLIAALPESGVAVLNADDPNVRAMGSRCAGRVITYGVAGDAMVRAEKIQSAWPEPLSFTLIYHGESLLVQTQLYGTHWVPCVLAAVSVGISMGIPLEQAARAVQTIPPYRMRMSPVLRKDGVAFMRDDRKAPLWAIPAAFEFMKDARATRKVIVVGTISDYIGGKSTQRYVSVAKQALDVADYVVFVGSKASKCLGARKHPKGSMLHAFYSLDAGCEYLRKLLQSGDLVLLKGTDHDNLGRIISATSATGLSEMSHAAALPDKSDALAASVRPVQAVIGLGNPGEKYHSTPHNIGQNVLDLVAKSFQAEWSQEDDHAAVCRIERNGMTVYLIKPLTYVNTTGPEVLKLSRRLGFSPAQCILVHDDIDLPFGSVRNRMRGSDGGHRGVRSILEAFQTDAFRRVKVGVGHGQKNDRMADYVLSSFLPEQLPTINAACAKAADRVLEMIRVPASSLENGIPDEHSVLEWKAKFKNTVIL